MFPKALGMLKRDTGQADRKREQEPVLPARCAELYGKEEASMLPLNQNSWTSQKFNEVEIFQHKNIKPPLPPIDQRICTSIFFLYNWTKKGEAEFFAQNTSSFYVLPFSTCF